MQEVFSIGMYTIKVDLAMRQINIGESRVVARPSPREAPPGTLLSRVITDISPSAVVSHS